MGEIETRDTPLSPPLPPLHLFCAKHQPSYFLLFQELEVYKEDALSCQNELCFPPEKLLFILLYPAADPLLHEAFLSFG